MGKILVTGGCGFIGSHLIKKLVEFGDEIIVIDNLSRGGADKIRIGSSNVKLVVGDLLDKPKLNETIGDCEFVFHLAANPEVRIGYKNPGIDFEQNIVATYNLLEAMRKSPHAKTLIFTSTSTIYGEAKEIPTREDYGPLIPISLYGASKLSCEALISAYSHLFDMKTTIFRFANVVGPGGHGVVQDLLRKLEVNASELEVLGDGTQMKSYMYIDDCIDALLFGLKHLPDPVDVFNIGSENQIDVRTIVKIIMEETKSRSIRVNYTGGIDGGRGWKGDVKNMMLDISRIRRMGWEPRYNSDESIRLTVRNWRKESSS